MPLNLRSRRTVLAAGAGLGGIGFVGISALKFGTEEEPPGPQGFSAMLAPAGSDPLVMAHIDSVRRSPISKSVLRTLLRAKQFDDLPPALTNAFSDPPTNVGAVGTVVLVGSDVGTDAGGAIIWANWTADDMIQILKSGTDTAVRSESYREQTMYSAGDTAAAKVDDTMFLFGTPAVVRDLIVAFTGDDTKPVRGKTLRSFARTPLFAHIRYSFETLGLSCDTAPPAGSDVYDDIMQVYGSVPESGDGVRLHLRVKPNAETRTVATNVRADLDAERYAFVEDITVMDEHDYVAIEYSPDSDATATNAGGVLEAVVCRCGLSR